MSEEIKPKKQRALPRVWKPFHQLNRGETFYVGKKLVVKTSPISGREVVREACLSAPLLAGDLHFVWPWRRVKTTEYVRDARPGGKTSEDWTVEDRTITVAREPRLFSENLKEAIEKDRPSRADVLHRPHVSQPSSDNNVTGPTS